MYFELMEESVKNLGISIDRNQYRLFEKYKNLLKEWNEKMNLTAITEDEEIFKKHFIDSIKVFEFKEVLKAEHIIDVGTGAGFPGIPMKIMMPETKLTLLDSLNKRLNFLRAVSEELELSDVQFVHSRAEDGARLEKHRENYDIAVSRAVANLTLLSELCIPYVKKGGYFIALKGPAVEDEIKEATKAIEILGGKLREIKEITIEGLDYKHNLVIIEKIKNTPKSYPRSSAAIKKSLIK